MQLTKLDAKKFVKRGLILKKDYKTSLLKVDFQKIITFIMFN